MSKKQIATKGTYIGLTTAGVICAFHFLGTALAGSTPGDWLDDSLKYAMPTLAGALWFYLALLIVTRGSKVR